jgi:hypothetical protein
VGSAETAAEITLKTIAGFVRGRIRSNPRQHPGLSRRSALPAPGYAPAVRASAEPLDYKEAIAVAVAEMRVHLAVAVRLQFGFTVDRGHDWLNLWTPTIDELDALLGSEESGAAMATG